jgi:hypothetical protein
LTHIDFEGVRRQAIFTSGQGFMKGRFLPAFLLSIKAPNRRIEGVLMRAKLNLSLDEQVISTIKSQAKFATASAYITDLVQRDQELARMIIRLDNKIDAVLQALNK